MSETAEHAKIPLTGAVDTDPPIDHKRSAGSLNEKGTALFQSTSDLHEKKNEFSRYKKVLKSLRLLNWIQLSKLRVVMN